MYVLPCVLLSDPHDVIVSLQYGNMKYGVCSIKYVV